MKLAHNMCNTERKNMVTVACSGGSSRRTLQAILVAIAVALGSWFYVAVQPDEPRLCGSEGGLPVTAPRVRLRDGRFLAYSESGAPKDAARFKIVFCHGFGGSRLDGIHPSQELVEELGVYIVSYDRAGYGESDPHPNRSPKSEALDVQDLADALNLGPRFYLIGFSLGGHAVWASLKYIPGRLAGAAFLAPVVNYRWPGLPANISRESYGKQESGDRWALRVAYYAPWLLNWWMKQSWLPTSTVVKGTVRLPNRLDASLRDYAISSGLAEKIIVSDHIDLATDGLVADDAGNRAYQYPIRFRLGLRAIPGCTSKRRKLAAQQGFYESYIRDMIVAFGKWEFSPLDLLQPPFPVHLWQGDEDGLVPVALQRHICSRLRWIDYHELSMTGHYLSAVPGFGDLVLKTLLLSSST